MLRLGVLISGSGSNLQAIIDAIAAGRLDAEVAVVISNKADAYGLVRAEQAHIPTVVVSQAALVEAIARETGTTIEKDQAIDIYNCAVRDHLIAAEVDLVVMAGYMRLLGREVLNAFPQRVLNLHPALLPAFPGAHGIADALAYGAKVTGVTVHFADEVFDRGPIIAQRAVEILETDTEESLAKRIHEVEHEIYPATIQLIAQGRLSFDGRCVRISE